MSDPTTIAQTYLDTWNEADAERRAARLRQAWARDASYVDPLMSAEGAEPIGALIGAVHERFPGFRFSLVGKPDGHGEHVRFSWALGPAGARADEAPIGGSDVLELREGRIARVIGFLDKVPAAA